MICEAMKIATRQALIMLTACMSLSTCDAAAEPLATAPSSVPQLVSDAGVKSIIKTEPRLRAAGEGTDYNWGKDHIFVKLSSAETGGLLTLIQDNLKSGFNLGPHFHRTHTEIFYILEGEVEFTTDKTSFTAKTGSVVYLPAGTPHAAKSSTGGRMLMFYSPGGFDNMLSEIENASWFQRLNPFARAERDRKYDFNKITGDTGDFSDAPAPIFVKGGEGKSKSLVTGSRTVKLNSIDTNGLATLVEETLKPGLVRDAAPPNHQAEVLYVLNGELELNIANKTQVAGKGATIFVPAGVRATLKSSSGANFLAYRSPSSG